MISITLNGHQKAGKIIDHRCHSNSNSHFTLLLLYAAIAEIQAKDGTVTDSMKEWHDRESFRLSQLGIEKKDLKSKEEIIPQGSVPGPGPGGVIEEDQPEEIGPGNEPDPNANPDGDGAALKETVKADTGKKEEVKTETAKADTGIKEKRSFR